jgi:murein DD-endopeptidase MepM/ murein hydrolase activator NlpD
MPSATRPLLPACGVAGVWLSLILAVIAGGGSRPAYAADPGQLEHRIGATQSRISGLKSAVGAASGRVSSLDAGISALEGQIASIQADLDAKRAALLKIRGSLSAARTRLAELERYEAHAQDVLARQLVGGYESARPDIVSVVLESHGFRDLLNRLAFAQQVRNQDVRIVGQVRAARRAVAAQATRLGGLEKHQQALTVQILDQRNRLALNRIGLVRRQIVATRARDASASQLIAARSQAAGFRRELARFQAAQAAAQARTASTPNVPQGASGYPGSRRGVSAGSGFIFPLPRGSGSPPSGWSLDDGVDMSAPGGTPEIAVCSGTVVLHGIGGFGPSAPVLHCDAPLGGYGYVYYGHAGPGNWVAVGTHLNAGQVISEVGSGIVGISTGPHLEIGFADSSGSPVGPSSASQMMSLLQGAYGG